MHNTAEFDIEYPGAATVVRSRGSGRRGRGRDRCRQVPTNAHAALRAQRPRRAL